MQSMSLAVKNLKRIPILWTLMLVIALQTVMIIVCLSVFSGAENEIRRIKDTFKCIVTIKEKPYIDSNIKNGAVKCGDVEFLFSSEYVDGYYYETCSAWGSLLGFSKELVQKTETPSKIIELCNIDSSKFTFSGVQSLFLKSQFTTGRWKLVGGRFFTDEENKAARNVAIIHKAYAESLGISVGNTVYSNYIGFSGKYVSADKFTIVGIYDGERFTDEQNTVFIPFNTFLKLAGESAGAYQLNMYSNPPKPMKDMSFEIRFLLKKPDSAFDFIRQALNGGVDSQIYAVVANDKYYQKTINALSNIKYISLWFALSSATAGSVILFLIITNFMFSRKYEVGVLLLLGMKQKHIYLSFIWQIAIAAIIAIAAGCVFGSALCDEAAAMSLGFLPPDEEDITESMQFLSHTNPNFFEQTKIDLQMQPFIKPHQCLLVFAFGLSVSIISAMVNLYRYSKIEPMRLLTERAA